MTPRLAPRLLLIAAAACQAAAPPASTSSASAAPAAASSAPSAIGTWRGTSQCTVRPSPCNDEIAVYHIAAGATADDFAFQGNKLVDGHEQEMGPPVPCHLQRPTNQLACPIAKGTFLFTLDGDRLHGTLVLTDGTVYRRIEVARDH